MQDRRHYRTDSAAAPVRVHRRDRAQLLPAERTADGFLRCQAFVARPGVMKYLEDGKEVLEYIPAEELHKADSLATLASVPVTLHHPPENVTPDNVSTYQVGDVGEEVEILKDGGLVRVVMVIRRRDAIDAIDGGLNEVSPGYTCVVDPTPGTHPEFGRYDRIQRDRRYNHTAVVDEARGGASIHLRADEAVQCTRLDATTAPTHTPPPEAPVKIPSYLLLIAAALGVPTTRKDAEGEKPLDMDAMCDAITEKVMDMKARLKDAEHGSEKTDEDDPEALKARIAELEGELATMKAADKERMDAAQAAADKAEREQLGTLADSLRMDTTAWTDATSNADRKLAIVRHKGLVKADETVDPQMVNGMVLGLIRQDAARTDDAWSKIKVEPKPADPKQPAGRSDSKALSSDPFKDKIRKAHAAK